jgi:type I restriction enzyme S subunit
MAPDGIKQVLVSDLIAAGALAINDGYRVRNSELGPTGIPFVRGGDIGDGWISTSVRDHIRTEFADRVKTKLVQPDDVAFISKGTVGRVGRVRHGQQSFVFAPQVCYWRVLDRSALDPGYLFHLLKSSNFKQHLDAVKTQGSMVADYVSMSDQRRFRLPVPTIAGQRCIAHILGTLDDKIDLNRRMNETLEAMARALFKSWFIDFDPVRDKVAGRKPAGIDAATAALFPSQLHSDDQGHLPEGWHRRRIDEIAKINGSTLSKNDTLRVIDYVEISEVMRGDVVNVAHYTRGTEPSRARRRLRHGDTVLSTVRPDRGAFFLCLNPSDSLIASTGFAVVTPEITPWSIVHCALTQPEVFEHLGRQADGGAYPAVSAEVIGAYPLASPADVNLLDLFHRIAKPMLERADQNRREARVLATTRDALLPKLLSGELQVPEAENLART